VIDIQNPPPANRIDVERHKDRTTVRVNGELVCERHEQTGQVFWNALGGRLTEADKAIINREVWAKLPWVPRVGPRNRAERRRLAHLGKKR
jgi:hypothetical protein